MELTGHLSSGGGIHGAVQVIENIFRWDKVEKTGVKKIASVVMVFFICNISLVVFRARTIADAFYILGNIVVPSCGMDWYLHSGIGIAKSSVITLIAPIAMVFIYDYVSLKKDVLEWLADKQLIVRWGIYIIIVFWTILKMPLEVSSFIYFQF